MPSGADFLKEKPKSSFLFAGNFGEGKTSVAITFPKYYYIGFRPGGLAVLNQVKNDKYKNNLVHYEELVESSDEELKDFFKPKLGKIHDLIKQAKQMAQEGKVETLVIDDLTDGVESYQKYIWTYEHKATERGADDNQSMYGLLKQRVSSLFRQDILTFRRYGNVIVNVHLMRESDQAIEGTATRAGAVEQRTNIYPDIVGSLRREIQRDFENVIYLESKVEGGKPRKFIGYTEKCRAFGTTILAKNSLGLKNPIEDITYDAMMINNQKGEK